MKKQLILWPAPQRLHPRTGKFKLKPSQLVVLPTRQTALMSMVRRFMQQWQHLYSLNWSLTAYQQEGDPVGVILAINPSQVAHPEGYRLVIEPKRVVLISHDAAGLFYGLQTLTQLFRQSTKGMLPCLAIEDWPDFTARGLMLDISRDKVPTLDTLFELVDLAASLKLNQLQLYTEHTFAYRRHPKVWANASPVTGEDILLLDHYCRERFIELVPNQNSFGHLAPWLQWPAYQHLAEAPRGWRHPLRHSWQKGPFSLYPSPESLAFLSGLYDELLPHFSSSQLNVGCDETFDLGQGRSKAACAERGKGKVYLEFLQGIHQEVSRRGKTMQFWGDIILHYPDLLAELPDGITALTWGYEANHPFASECEQLAAADVPFYVCPGTSSWNSIAGRTDNALANLQLAATEGYKHGALGYLITDWGDNGHWQPWPVTFPPLAWGAAMAWHSQGVQSVDLAAALDWHVFHDSQHQMGQALLDLGNSYLQTGVDIPNNSALGTLLLFPDDPFYAPRLAELTAEKLNHTSDWIQDCLERLKKSQLQRFDHRWIPAELNWVGQILQHACHLGLALTKHPDHWISALPPRARQKLAKELQTLIPSYQTLWLNRNRPGGLSSSVGRMESLLKRYQTNKS